MTKVAGRPLRADARRNRERVLNAAREVFSREGMDAQIDDVARQAAVGVGTVYRHFPTKDALIQALAEDSLERVADAAQAQLEREDCDAFEAFAQALWNGASIFALDRSLCELMVSVPGTPAMEPTTAQRLDTTVGELLRRAQAEGSARADLVLDDVGMVMCGIGAATRKQHICADAWKRHLSIVIDGMRSEGARAPLPTSLCEPPEA